MTKKAIIIMIITIISKLFGFARDIILSYFYGTSNISDAYVISLTIPTVIFGIVSGGIAAGYIPMYSRIEKDKGSFESNNYTNNLLNILIVICTFIVILGYIFTDKIVILFASGFDENTLKLTVDFTRITILGIYFTGMMSIFSGYLQIKGCHIVPASVGIPLDLITILSIILGCYINTKYLVIGSVIAIASQVFISIPFAVKNGYKYRFIINLKDKNIITMARMLIPIIIGISLNEINILIDRTIASQISVGGISALNYADRLIGFIKGIFVVSITSVMYSMVTEMIVNQNYKELERIIHESISSIIILIIPITIGTMIYSRQIVEFLFARGAFNKDAVNMTSDALFFYSVGILGYGIRDVLSRVFYSFQDTKTPMLNATLGMLLNIILNITLSKYLGIGGLALATSISSIVTTCFMTISLKRKFMNFNLNKVFILIIKVLISSLIMGILSKLSYMLFMYMMINKFISLILAVGIGAILYFIIIYCMKINEIIVITDYIKNKFKTLNNNKR